MMSWLSYCITDWGYFERKKSKNETFATKRSQLVSRASQWVPMLSSFDTLLEFSSFFLHAAGCRDETIGASSKSWRVNHRLSNGSLLPVQYTLKWQGMLNVQFKVEVHICVMSPTKTTGLGDGLLVRLNIYDRSICWEKGMQFSLYFLHLDAFL
jgi:hypothetical protein